MRALALAALAACYSPKSVAPCAVTCATGSDCPSGLSCIDNVCASAGEPACGQDGPGPDPDATVLPTNCAGMLGPLGEICVDPASTIQPLSGTVTIDTDSDALCAMSIAPGCVLVVDAIASGVSIRATGSRPLIVWSPTVLMVDGTIDVSSHFLNGDLGAGASPSECPAIDGPASAQASGGAGGSLGSSGGRGGSSPTTIGVGPKAIMNAPKFHGGCPGGRGGACDVTNAGPGGGAVYLVAKMDLTVTGKINASGAGGGPPIGTLCGGGGAGSGGWIAFDAPTIKLESSAVIVAFGGGGGSANNSAGGGGNPGKDPMLDPPTNAAGTLAVGPCSTHSNGGGGALGNATGGGGDGTNSGDVSCSGGGGGGGNGKVTTSPGLPIVNTGVVKPPPREFPAQT